MPDKQKHGIHKKDDLLYKIGVDEDMIGLSEEMDEAVIGGGEKLIKESREEMSEALDSVSNDPDMLAFDANRAEVSELKSKIETLLDAHFDGRYKDSNKLLSGVSSMLRWQDPKLSQARLMREHLPRLNALAQELQSKIDEVTDYLGHQQVKLKQVLKVGHKMSNSRYIKTEAFAFTLNEAEAEFARLAVNAGKNYEKICELNKKLTDYIESQTKRFENWVATHHSSLEAQFDELSESTENTIQNLHNAHGVVQVDGWRPILVQYRRQKNDFNMKTAIYEKSEDVFERVSNLIDLSESFAQMKKLSDELTTNDKVITKKTTELNARYEAALHNAQSAYEAVAPMLALAEELKLDAKIEGAAELKSKLEREEPRSLRLKISLTDSLSKLEKQVSSKRLHLKKQLVNAALENSSYPELQNYLEAFGVDFEPDSSGKMAIYFERLRHSAEDTRSNDLDSIVEAIRELVSNEHRFAQKLDRMKFTEERFEDQKNKVLAAKEESRSIREQLMPLMDAFGESLDESEEREWKEKNTLLYTPIKKTYLSHKKKTDERLVDLNKINEKLKGKLVAFQERKEVIDKKYAYLDAQVDHLVAKAAEMDKNAAAYQPELLKDEAGDIDPHKHAKQVARYVGKVKGLAHLKSGSEYLKYKERLINKLTADISETKAAFENSRKKADFKKLKTASRKIESALGRTQLGKKLKIQLSKFERAIPTERYRSQLLETNLAHSLRRAEEIRDLFQSGFEGQLKLFGEKPTLTVIRKVLNELTDLTNQLKYEQAKDVIAKNEAMKEAESAKARETIDNLLSKPAKKTGDADLDDLFSAIDNL